MRRLVPAAAALLLAGCMGLAVQVGDPHPGSEAGAPTLKPASAKEAPSGGEEREEAAIASVLERVEKERATYRISAADLLEVTVYQEKDLDRKVRVSPDGVITLPLAGAVRVAGLSVADAETAITERLKKYLISPTVSVFISEYGNKRIYVLGEVAKPGSYPLPTEARLSVIEAITLAGGFTQYAAPERTRVIRKSKTGDVRIPINITSIIKGKDKESDLALEPNDVVHVPESRF